MRNRRGLSTVVGIVFFVIAMTSVITYISFSMDTIERFGQSVLVKKSVDIDRGNEKFEIIRSEIVDGKFNFTIQNLGTIPVKFTRLFVENKTDSTWTPARYTIDREVTYGESITNIGQNIPLQALNTQSYSLKLMTARGNAAQFFVNSVGTQPLNVNLRALPGTIPTGFQTLLVLDVTNNAPNISKLLNLRPELDSVVQSCPSGECLVTYVSGPTPTSFDSLAPGDIASFEWVYKITGDAGDSVDFTASLVDGISEDTATVTVTSVQEAIESGSALIAQGLNAVSLNDDILVFHQETINVPSNNYQMASSATDGGNNGLRIELDKDRPQFWTNSAAADMTVPAGIWTVSMRLQSEAMPNELIGKGEDLIFHFEDGPGIDPDNSESNSSRDLKGCTPEAYEIDAGTDDAEEDNGSVTTTSTDLDLQNPQYTGLRWIDINISPGATIASANIEFTAEGQDSGTSPTYTIYGEKIADAPTFSATSFSISSRDPTGAQVIWSNVPAWSNGESGPDTTTPDISSIIQEIVNQEGWSSGNALVIIIHASGGNDRDAESFEGNQFKTAKLTINLQASGGVPEWQATSGPHESGAYYFDGDDCFRSKNDIIGGGNNINGEPDTTSLWFKTDGIVTGEQFLVAWKDGGTLPNTEHYQIGLDNFGKVKFRFGTGGSHVTTCLSVNEYDDDKWYHVVAVRESGDWCALYITDIDGNDAEAVITQDNTYDTYSVDASGKWHVGSNKDENGNWFKGWIDDIIHWNDRALSSNEADDLSKTNYGTGAHQFSFYLERTDDTGNSIEKYQTFIDEDISFQDPKGGDNNDDSTYGIFNVTLSMPLVDLTATQRINFTMLYQTATPTWEPLEIDMKVDDEGLNPYSSYLQIPPPSIPFPSYWIYDNDDKVEFWFLNLGPNGIWLQYQGTRVIFNDNDSDTSYAGLVRRVNGTTGEFNVDADKDSLFIPVGSKAFIRFWEPTTVPSNNPPGSGALIPPGFYKTSVWLSAYDDAGETFSRSISLGTVEVID